MKINAHNQTFESRIARIRFQWNLFLIGTIFILLLLYINYNLSVVNEFNYTNKINAVSISYQDLSMSLGFSSLTLFVSAFSLFFLAGVAKISQTDKITDTLFNDSAISKSKVLQGTIVLDNNETLRVEWSNKGYFIIYHLDKPIAHAKSSELYWKTLLVRHTLSI